MFHTDQALHSDVQFPQTCMERKQLKWSRHKDIPIATWLFSLMYIGMSCYEKRYIC